jgi:signal transduction histidine kinase
VTPLLLAVAAVEVALCAGVALLLAVRRRARPSPATTSALGVFVVVGVVIPAGAWQPADPTRGWGALYVEVLVCVLLALPYLQARLAWAMGGLGDRTHRLLAALLGLEVVVTLATPALPAVGDPRPGWVVAYTVFVVLAWSTQSLAAAVGLWRAGSGASAVVRNRMRSLSSGAVVMTVALVAITATGGGADGRGSAVLALLGLAGVLLFALAFLVPSWLRLVWRQEDLVALGDAERGLMAATTRDEVAATIVPVLSQVLGAGDVTLLDEHGAPLRTASLAGQAGDLTAVLAGARADGTVQEVAPGLLAVGLHGGWLVVRAGRLAPVFGDDEAVLLGRVATLVDLALQRVGLFEQERASRAAAEAVGADLETLLYSVSHDLRSPLISVLGYLDVLRAEHAEALTGDGAHYLERISVNAVYMQALIADLLELSRIGRTDPPAEALALDDVARQVVESARLAHPRASVAVEGTLPVVRMSDVRARQLLTNLVDNALLHGGRDDVSVVVSASPAADGGLLLQVADDGVGVPVEYRDRVLRVFERLAPPRSSPGTGMGLAICKRIAESLGGTLVLGGPPPRWDSGTTVSVVLPAPVLVQAVPEPREAEPSSPHVPADEERV